MRHFALLACLLLTALQTLAQDATAPAAAIANPGFEKAKDGWEPEQFQRYETLVAIDRTLGHSGNLSLRISNRRGSEQAFLSQLVEGIQGGATYVLSGWVKGDGRTVPSLPALRIEFQDAEGRALTSRSTRRQPLPTGEWERWELPVRADLDARKARVSLQLFGPGAAWFDDIALDLQAPSPGLELIPERLALDPSAPAPVRLTVRLAEPWSGEAAPVQVRLVSADGAETPLTDLALELKDPRTCVMSLDATRLGAAPRELRAYLGESAGFASARVFTPPADRKPAHLSETGLYLSGGEPFFPIGLCHVGAADYATVAKQGFNAVQGLAEPSPAVLSGALAAALAADLRVDAPLYAWGQLVSDLPATRQRVAQSAAQIALLSWKMADAPDALGQVADHSVTAYAELKSADWDHPFALTLTEPGDFGFWARFCDVMQVATYPDGPEPITVVGERVRQARAAAEPWQNVTALLRAGWRQDPLNQPTFAQARLMVYLALINGARGIFWYAYRDPGWRLADTPLWARFKEINEETAQLAQPILRGTPAEGLQVEPQSADLQWLAFAHGDSTYVLLANTSKEAIEVRIAPGRQIASAPCLRGRPATVEGGTVLLTALPESAETVILHHAKAAEPAAQQPAQ